MTLINQSWTHPWLDWLMIALSTLGLGWLALMGLATLRQGVKPLRWGLLAAQLGAVAGVLLFYWLAARTRPEAVRLVLLAPALPSFPSGHSAIAAASVTFWWLQHGWNRRTAAVVALAVGVAYSRIYLGHHYPTDVLAGLVWGMGAGAAAYGITRHWGDHRDMVGWLLWPQIALAVLVSLMAYLGLLPLYLLSWPFADKVLHLLLIGALAFWLNIWLPDWQVQMGRVRLPVAVLLPFALAAAEEVMQGWSPLRTFDLGDLASDLVGLLLFYALSRWMMARMQTRVVVE